MLKFDHITITVSNLEKSIEFYRDILNMKVLGKLEQEAATFVYLEFESGEILKLFKFDEEGKSYDYKPDKDIGIKHFGLRVNDVDKVTENLKEKGIEFTLEPLSTDGVRLAFFKDPDGISIEIIEGELDLIPYE